MAKPAVAFYHVLRMPIADILQCARAAEEAGFGRVSVAALASVWGNTTSWKGIARRGHL
jgi:hypothetical protein